jgi:hypothetical protein
MLSISAINDLPGQWIISTCLKIFLSIWMSDQG